MTGNISAWMLTSVILVIVMTSGLAFFYGGMVRAKNATATLYHMLITGGLIGLVWIILGCSLAFTGDNSGFIGTSDNFLLKLAGRAGSPTLGFALYHMTFAIFAAGLLYSAFAERVRYSSWLWVATLWSLLVYAPIVHWVWTSSGWLAQRGVLDFAGGFAVLMAGGFSALAAAIAIGKRQESGQPHNMAMVVLGISLLGVGWFGMTTGSAGALTIPVFLNTFVASAAGLLAWTVYDRMKDGRPTTLGGCAGALAGLAAITSAAGYVTLTSAIIIGLLAGVLCNAIARSVKNRFNVDDTLGIFATAGVGGALGVILTGVLATTAVNSAGGMGMWHGSQELLTDNVVGALAVAIYSMVATTIIVKVVNAVKPVRVAAGDEMAGLDATHHGEKISSL